MPKAQTFIDIVDELIEKDVELIEEFVKEELKPIMDYNRIQELKLFEKAYQELLALEREEA